MMWAAVHEAFARLKALPGADWHELSLGVPLTLLVFLAVASNQLGMMGRSFYAPYREWWARVAGWILILTTIWAAGFALSIYAPLGVLWLRDGVKAAGGLWIVSTAIRLLGGKSEETGGTGSSGLKNKLLSITPYIFIVGLASFLALSLEPIFARFYWAQKSVQAAWNGLLAESPAVSETVNWLLRLSGDAAAGKTNFIGTTSSYSTVQSHFIILNVATNWLVVHLYIGALLACLLLSYQVELNASSVSMVLKNRLIRCFLGATTSWRDPDPLSGTGLTDDFLLNSLRSSNGYSGPLPILNGAVNLINSRGLSGRERQVESFPMTPLRCGFDTAIEQANLERNFAQERQMGMAGENAKYAYRPTEKFTSADGGITLGTAMSISGPSYDSNLVNSSLPSPALLMSFLNLRLGFWAGNPRNDTAWQRPGPTVELIQLLKELFGSTNDNAKYVYLSDGGDFENLGVYELVKRRCKYILACDVSPDPNYAMDDLGNAIRKCREDLGGEIELDTTSLIPPSGGADGDKVGKRKLVSKHVAVGRIRYDMADPNADDGIFVYFSLP